jgi:AraC-like DNA-binding protein
MKTPARRIQFTFDEFRRRRRSHLQYHGYPSEVALDLWEHVLQIGTSRCPRGYKFTNDGLRRGYLLHYIREGALKHVIRGETYRAGRGEFILLDFGKGHLQFNDEPATTHVWWLYFDGKDMTRTFAELGADHDPLFTHVDARRFETLFRELWIIVSKQPIAHEPRAHALLHAILAGLFAARPQRITAPTLVARKSALSENVRKAVNVIEMSYYMNIGLKQISAHAGADPYHLAHKFREEVGMPPIQYLNRYRVEIAKRLLATSDKAVSEVARLVGVPDESYFARTFRRLVGKTPQAFRKSALTGGHRG